MQRIIETLSNDGFHVEWISRSLTSKPDIDSQVDHHIISPWIKKGPLFYLEFNLRLLIKLFWLRYDIVSAVDLDTIMPCYLASRIRNKKLIFDAHEIFYEVPELEGKEFKKSIWKLIAKICIPSSALAYTVNQSLKHHYEEKFNTPFKVIYNVPPLYSEEDLSDPLQRENIIIYLGVLNKGRGIEIAINAMTKLPNYKLILLGEGDIMNELKELVARLELKDRVEFKGYVEPKDIKSHLRKAKIAINILKASSENYRLSLANKFFDYMHAGIPSINMAYPEYSRIIDQHRVGLCIDSYTAEDFINAVRQLENQDTYLSIVNQCILHKNQYAWEAESKKLTAMYKQLIDLN